MNSAAEAPVSMMVIEKIKLLLELLRYGLSLGPGSVLEMGSWQGGSSWYIAKTLALMVKMRPLYLMDLFETHRMDRTATMCTDEIRLRMQAAFPNTHILTGLVDNADTLSKVEGPISFAHFDLGCVPGALSFILDNLAPGAPLLIGQLRPSRRHMAVRRVLP